MPGSRTNMTTMSMTITSMTITSMAKATFTPMAMTSRRAI